LLASTDWSTSETARLQFLQRLSARIHEPDIHGIGLVLAHAVDIGALQRNLVPGGEDLFVDDDRIAAGRIFEFGDRHGSLRYRPGLVQRHEIGRAGDAVVEHEDVAADLDQLLRLALASRQWRSLQG
jgi:hypothetical protein